MNPVTTHSFVFEMTTNATSTAENVNSLLGLSRNDHTAMLCSSRLFQYTQ